MIPDEARRRLEPLMTPGIPWQSITLHLEPLAQGISANIPHATVARSVVAVTLKGLARTLKTVGMAIGNHVWIAPEFAKWDTASGLALLAHELVHVLQDQEDPNFARKYDAEARKTPPDKPWLNHYELASYCQEAAVYKKLVAQGMKPGSWKPLAIEVGFACP